MAATSPSSARSPWRRIAGVLPSWLQPGERVAFDPFSSLPFIAAVGFVLVRAFGLVVLVPLAEELFWRGFLLRWIVNPDWEQVDLGRFTWGSCLGVTVLFSLAHPEWVAAAAYCLLVNGLLYWKRDLWQCVVAHAVSNLLLIVYVLSTGEWTLW